MITVIFTCKGRPSLTELCLRRLVELMPQPYELFICYDGDSPKYERMLRTVAPEAIIVMNLGGVSRFQLINVALEDSSGDLFMHVENDFYWVDAGCLDSALNAFHRYPELHYIRFELLPFTQKNFDRYEQADGKDICWMREESPFKFTFNPHIRRFKYPTDEPFKTEEFTKQPEQHHNDGYLYQSACMTGDNWRHLGIYSEGGHYKPYYGERFYNQRGKQIEDVFEVSREFHNFAPTYYWDLFRRYISDNWNKHST